MRKIFNLYKLHKVHKTVKYFSAAYFTPKKKIKECLSIHCNVIFICKVKRASGGQGYTGKYIVLVLVSALKPKGVWCMIRVDYCVKFSDLANVQV